MTEGYAAHLIMLPNKEYKSSIALIDDSGILLDICSLKRETPFTRFFDGALLILKESDTPQNYHESPKIGEKVSVWQLYPYDLVHKRVKGDTRYFKRY